MKRLTTCMLLIAFLLIALLLVATTPGYSAEPDDGQEAAIAALKKLGGDISSTKVALIRNQKVTDADLMHLKALKNLTTLYLPYTNVGDAGLQKLKGLTKLTNLYLPGTQGQRACDLPS